ncbi:MAG TPA: PhnD/SsuA/transferrin family substrate-binding protein [Polyangiaceae bacterium LLY-WYZ-15_(1-7)]|nr:PhnD/SsuA/transferrin family substrate-binding protein [Polyangiaceae bacterium LLY-WYZ-15_(1-7)]HJL08602.1 PhnD/SsuA/transferrin family substrate-binding protein [Polyangiaceae bacterium LLY-WYZ-15_(1-7)]HJL25109.1 PhnD/SsuA/transferrin family substrate-binding protein [Polyangiaceae bacterium LLY-WYZ-15_(1-7)]HJL33922.1 PhnD/SsuA/transferrin family substrate-binding protein [Polyangiaceae bacterium LLY-WYZ-15_(1-7)]HJL39283.1 PhnD/SsuA/transferrin family substrate-binding protein [Polyangi
MGGSRIFATGPSGSGESTERIRDALGWLLTGALGEPVELRAYATYEALLDALPEVDLAWLPPAVYVRARSRQPLWTLAALDRGEGLTYRGAIFVRSDGPFAGVGHLDGARMGWVAPESASGHLFPRLALLEAGVRPSEVLADERYYGSHEAVVRAVAEGEVDAGACYVHTQGDRLRAAAWAKAGAPMQALVLSRPIPADVIVGTAKLAPSFAPTLLGAFTALAERSDGPALLESLFGASGLRPTSATRYDVVREALASVLA